MSRLPDVFLNPGDFWFTNTPCLIRTILGSCISITLWHPRLHTGGMCHYVLPSRSGNSGSGQPDGRYADEAFDLFLTELQWYGTRPGEYEVGMFGGGDQFGGSGPFDVPRRNVLAGQALLEAHGFRLAAHDVGGAGARRLALDMTTGKVTVDRIGTLFQAVAA